MARQVSLRDANQGFARLIREVERGEEIVVTRRGQPVARIVPAAPVKRKLTPEQEAAWQRILDAAKDGYTVGDWKFNRDELHER
jgi:prevent-host-death family protein